MLPLARFAADKPQRLIAETLGFEASVCSFSHPSRRLPQRLPITKGGRRKRQQECRHEIG
jgi:hypothetical protein